MSKYYGLIIPRSYNDYFSRSDPQAIKEIINTGTDAQLDEESAAPIQNQAVAKLVPAAASEENRLADKAFVNSTVGTNTAIFRGTFDSVEALEAYAGEKTNNDYAFVIDTDSAGNTEYNRYKYDGSAWVYEYTLNNSSFTAEQWAAIQSGITEELVAKIGDTGIIPITSADYEDLPEDEKNADKLYLLNDAINGFITVTDTVEAGNESAVTSKGVAAVTSALNSEITSRTGKRTIYKGPLTFDLRFNNHAYLIISSAFAGYGAAFLLCGNYNSVCSVIKLGGSNFEVSAVHKENYVDTITVRTNNGYDWFIVEL